MRKKRKRISNIDFASKELTEDRYDNLVSQMEVLVNGDLFPSIEDREKCYQANKEEILERWLTDPQHLCKRPFAFWQFESLPERKVIGKHKW